MLLMILFLILSVASILITTYKDFLKEENNTFKKAIVASMIVSIISIGLLSYKEWKADQQEHEYRKNQQIQLVLQEVLKYRIAILDNYYLLLTKSMILNNYMIWEHERAKNDHYHLMKRWEDVASIENKEELIKAKTSFEQLQKIAREILILSATYQDIVPSNMVKWAERTLSLKFEELSKVIDAYNPSKEVLEYANLTGRGIGEVTGKAVSTSEKIVDLK